MKFKNLLIGSLIAGSIITGCSPQKEYFESKEKKLPETNVSLDTSGLRRKVDSLESSLENAGPSSFARLDLSRTKFNLEYARLVKNKKYPEARKHVNKEYKKYEGNNTTFEKFYEKFKKDIEERTKQRNRKFSEIYTSKEIDKTFYNMVKPLTEKNIKRTETFMKNLKAYVEDENKPKQLLKKYQNQLKAEKIDLKSEHDLNSITSGPLAKTRFQLKFNNMIENNVQKATKFINAAQRYCKFSEKCLSKDFLKKQRNYLSGIVSEKMDENEKTSMKKGYENSFNMPLYSKGEKMKEGIYSYKNGILVVNNFKYKKANPLAVKTEARKAMIKAALEADKKLVRFADFVDEKEGHYKQNEKIIGGDFFPYEKDSKIQPFAGVDEHTYQAKIFYSKVRANLWQKIFGYPFTEKLIQEHLKPISFKEDYGKIFSGNLNGKTVKYYENENKETYSLVLEKNNETYIMRDLKNKSSILEKKENYYSENLNDKIEKLEIIKNDEKETYESGKKLEKFSKKYNKIRKSIENEVR